MKQSGYTLIEILVVLFIISIVTSVAMLSIGRNDNKQMEAFANELTQVMTLAEEQAMLQTTVLGLSFTGHSYQLASFQSAQDNKKAGWLPVHDTVLGEHDIPSSIHVVLSLSGKKVELAEQASINPQIIISTSGEVTPFTIYVSKAGEKPRYAITGDADGNVTNTLLS
jgi:general secretion pathway protein H